MKKTLRICKKGHSYFKSSDCPTCPICEGQRLPGADFYKGLSAPARRALENAGILSLEKLSTFTPEELLKLHGLGKTSLPKLALALKNAGLAFKD